MTKHRHRLLSLTAAPMFGLCLAFTCVMAHGQAPVPGRPASGPASIPRVPSVPIPDSVRTGAAMNAAGVAQVGAFISAEAKNLANPDAAIQRQAREALVAAAFPVNKAANPNASPAFLMEYAGKVDEAMFPLLDAKYDPRIRLNAAIVLARIAEPANNTRLARATAAALKDPAEPVVLWGIKAARHIIPREFLPPKVPAIKALAGLVVQAAERWPTSWAINEEVAEALVNERTRTLDDAAKSDLLAHVKRLLDIRIAQYKKVAVPPNPGDPWPGAPEADTQAIKFLSNEAWRKNLPPNEKQGIATKLFQLLDEVVRVHEADLPRRGQGDGVTKDDLVAVAKQAGAVGSVIGLKESDPALQAASDSLSKVNLDIPHNDLVKQVNDMRTLFQQKGLLPANGAAVAGPN